MPDKNTFRSHPAEDALERFCMEQLPEPELATVEEHLLVCSKCRAKVDELDSFIAATKAAAVQVSRESPRPRWTEVSSFQLPVLALALGVAVVIYFAIPSRRSAAQSVELVAMRGTESAPPTARANAPLHLEMDLTEITPSPRYTVELVDATGRVKWEKHDADASGRRLAVDTEQSFVPGQYWVRLYASSLKTELLREYGLLLK